VAFIPALRKAEIFVKVSGFVANPECI